DWIKAGTPFETIKDGGLPPVRGGRRMKGPNTLHPDPDPLVAPAGATAADSRGEEPVVGEEPGGRVRDGGAGEARAAAQPLRGPTDPHPAREPGPDRPAAHAGGSGPVREGPLAGRLGEGGGPAPRQPALRRADGAPLAGPGPLRGLGRLPRRHHTA